MAKKNKAEKILNFLSFKILNPRYKGEHSFDYKLFGVLLNKLLIVEKKFGINLSSIYQKLRKLILFESKVERECLNVLLGLVFQLLFLNFFLGACLYVMGKMLGTFDPSVFRYLLISFTITLFVLWLANILKENSFKEVFKVQDCLSRLMILPHTKLSISDILKSSGVDQLKVLQPNTELSYLNRQLLQKLDYWRTRGGDLTNELGVIEDELHFIIKQKLLAYKKKIELLKVFILVFGFFPSLLWSYYSVLMDVFTEIQ